MWIQDGLTCSERGANDQKACTTSWDSLQPTVAITPTHHPPKEVDTPRKWTHQGGEHTNSSNSDKQLVSKVPLPTPYTLNKVHVLVEAPRSNFIKSIRRAIVLILASTNFKKIVLKRALFYWVGIS